MDLDFSKQIKEGRESSEGNCSKISFSEKVANALKKKTEEHNAEHNEKLA